MAPFATALLLAGCGGSATESMRETHAAVIDVNNTLSSKQAKPVDLTRARNASVPPEAAARIDEASIRPAIEAYARGKNETAGTFVLAGADLNGDGKAEALVLFTSERWCHPHGCPLAIFERGTTGWRHTVTIARIRPPIRVSASRTGAWRDIWARSGQDDARGKTLLRSVLLKWGTASYPTSAALALESKDQMPDGETIIAAAELQLPAKAKFAANPFVRKDEEKNKP
jgi:hypothetical protein